MRTCRNVVRVRTQDSALIGIPIWLSILARRSIHDPHKLELELPRSQLRDALEVSSQALTPGLSAADAGFCMLSMMATELDSCESDIRLAYDENARLYREVRTLRCGFESSAADLSRCRAQLDEAISSRDKAWAAAADARSDATEARRDAAAARELRFTSMRTAEQSAEDANRRALCVNAEYAAIANAAEQEIADCRLRAQQAEAQIERTQALAAAESASLHERINHVSHELASAQEAAAAAVEAEKRACTQFEDAALQLVEANARLATFASRAEQSHAQCKSLMERIAASDGEATLNNELIQEIRLELTEVRAERDALQTALIGAETAEKSSSDALVEVRCDRNAAMEEANIARSAENDARIELKLERQRGAATRAELEDVRTRYEEKERENKRKMCEAISKTLIMQGASDDQAVLAKVECEHAATAQAAAAEAVSDAERKASTAREEASDARREAEEARRVSELAEARLDAEVAACRKAVSDAEAARTEAVAAARAELEASEAARRESETASSAQLCAAEERAAAAESAADAAATAAAESAASLAELQERLQAAESQSQQLENERHDAVRSLEDTLKLMNTDRLAAQEAMSSCRLAEQRLSFAQCDASVLLGELLLADADGEGHHRAMTAAVQQTHALERLQVEQTSELAAARAELEELRTSALTSANAAASSAAAEQDASLTAAGALERAAAAEAEIAVAGRLVSEASEREAAMHAALEAAKRQTSEAEAATASALATLREQEIASRSASASHAHKFAQLDHEVLLLRDELFSLEGVLEHER